MPRTVKDVENEIASHPKFREVLRELGLSSDRHRPSVRLHGRERDKRRTADFERNWSPETDSIRISFESAAASPTLTENEIEPRASDPDGEKIGDLIRALDRAERRGLDFIALKWFRDTALPNERLHWAPDEDERQQILHDAIERRLVLTHKVANPKAPQFPVTAIRLNRLAPIVRAILGMSDVETFDRRPIAIRGAALSTTVLSDRR